MTTPFLAQDIGRDEGFRAQAYPDPKSPLGMEMAKLLSQRAEGWESLSGEPWTCGFGCTGPDVKPGVFWTLAYAIQRRAQKIAECKAELDRNLPWWRTMSDPRQDVFVGMLYNLGWPRFAGFKKMIAAVKAGDWATASAEIMDSRAAVQLHSRYSRYEAQMKSGIRPT